MKSYAKIISIAAISALVMLAAGCNRKDENKTAGEKLDSTIAEAKRDSREAGNAVEHTTDKAVQKIDDAAITATIKGKLVADDELKAIDINVDTSGGAVTLSGVAPSSTAVDRATTIAKSVDGVSNVNNQLTVKTN